MDRSAAARDRVREIADRKVTREEADAYLAAPVSDDERNEVLALRRWFCTRYPTAGERLAYVRRAYLRWSTTPTPP